MCIRDRTETKQIAYSILTDNQKHRLEEDLELDFSFGIKGLCLLYTSDAADERSSVDLGGRRIIKKKNGWYLRARQRSSTRSIIPVREQSHE